MVIAVNIECDRYPNSWNFKFLLIYLYHMGHVALWASVVGLVFLPYQHNEIEVVPDVMLKFNVLLEWYSLIIKLVPLETWSWIQIQINSFL